VLFKFNITVVVQKDIPESGGILDCSLLLFGEIDDTVELS